MSQRESPSLLALTASSINGLTRQSEREGVSSQALLSFVVRTRHADVCQTSQRKEDQVLLPPRTNGRSDGRDISAASLSATLLFCVYADRR